MSTRVYSEWSPGRSGFPESDRIEQIRFLLRFAILAPSGHNAQPWRFEIDRQRHTLHIKLDCSRLLRVSDPTDRVSYMCLGTSARNFVRAAESYGLAPTLTIVEDDGEYSVRVELEDGPGDADGTEIDWIDAISRRVSNRHTYSKEAISSAQQERLTDFAIPGVELKVFTSAGDKATIAELTARSSKKLINAKEFRRELSGYVHNNWTRAKTGMPASNQGIPDLISLAAPFAVKHARVGTWLSRRDKKQLTDAPMIVALVTNGESPHEWIRSGMAHEELFLRATGEGLALDTFAAATEDEEARKELAARLGLDGYPQILVRVGRPKKENSAVSHSPRLSVEDVLE
jgi:hypothetical protein